MRTDKRKLALSRISDACMYMSTSHDGSSLVSLPEAMFLDVSALCRKAIWSEDIILDGETGFLFDDTRSATDIILSADVNVHMNVADVA